MFCFRIEALLQKEGRKKETNIINEQKRASHYFFISLTQLYPYPRLYDYDAIG
jgi:hypothetical protein